MINLEKMNSLLAFFVSKNGGHIPMTKLLKLIYYADFTAAARLGQPITGATYRAYVMGPVCHEVWKGAPRGEFPAVRVDDVDDSLDFTIAEMPDIAHAFTPEEKAILDLIWSKYGSKPGRELSKLTHTETPWMVAWAGRDSGEDRIDYDLAGIEYSGNEPAELVAEDPPSQRAVTEANATLERLGLTPL